MDLTELVLNHEGEDYTVIVPLDTANELLNDPDAARTFIAKAISESQANQLEIVNAMTVDDTTCDLEANNNTERGKASSSTNLQQEQAHTSNSETIKNLVWTSKRPSNHDLQATEFFLKLRQEYGDRFDDRRTTKSQIWQLIVRKMNQAGYYVGEGRDAVEKCRIKFANMQKQYLLHIKHVNTTGEGKKSEPLFFSEIHAILGKKDIVDPKNVQDSLDDSISLDQGLDCNEEGETSTEVNDDENVEGGANADLIKNRFKSERSVRPKSANTVLIELMKDQHAQTLRTRKEELKIFTDLIDTQNQQRERFLNQFEKLVNNEISQKRKRSPSPESD